MCYVSYWGVKHTLEFRHVLKEYVKNLSTIILDPYGGSGGLARLMLSFGKRVIYNDLNPVAYLIARYNIAKNQEDLEDMKKCLIKIRESIDNVQELFYEHCHICNRFSEVKYRVYENGDVRAYLECGHIVKSADVSSYKPSWASISLSYSNIRFLKAASGLTLGDLFTRRNAMVIDMILNVLNECPTSAKYIVIPIIYLLSKMAFFPEGKENISKSWKPSWAVPAYWIPRRFIEYNPRLIIDTKIQNLSFCKSAKYKVGTVEEVLKKRAHIAFLNSDAVNLPLPPRSVDIVTDPPYPTDIQYGELYFFFAILLGFKNYDQVFQNELIVNKNRGFSLDDYIKRLDKHISKIHQVTKKHAIFIVKNSKNIDKILSIIEKYYDIKEQKDIILRKKRSRIGDHRDSYSYVVLFAKR
jgi:adenine-specific DNA methylase